MGRAVNEATIVRRLSLFDLDAFTRHLLRLDEASRHLRFGMFVSDDFLKEYAQGCARWDVVIYGYFIGDDMYGAAELRSLGAEKRREAEVAFSVETDWRGRGIATALFAKVIRTARNRGLTRLHMSCLATNRAMQTLARKFLAEITLDSDSMIGIIDPGSGNLISMVNEAADTAAAYAFATIRLPRFGFLRQTSDAIRR